MKKQIDQDVLPLVKNSLNAKLFPKNYERNNLPSMTIPDQSLSVKDILKRYARGLPLYQNPQQPIYEGDEMELPDLRKMDLAEIQELREYTQEKIKTTRENLEQQARKLREKELQDYNEWKKTRQEQKTNPAEPATKDQPKSS